MARPIDLAKWHEWAERLRRFERSGMSVCAWCRQEGVSEVQFYHWRRKLAAHGWLQGKHGGSGGRREGRTIVNGRSKKWATKMAQRLRRPQGSTVVNGHGTGPSNAGSALGDGVHRDGTRVGSAQDTAARSYNASGLSERGVHGSCPGKRPRERSRLFVPVEVVGSSIIEVLLARGVRVRVSASERRALCTVLRLATRMGAAAAGYDSSEPAEGAWEAI